MTTKTKTSSTATKRKKVSPTAPQFNSDFRKSNPALHRLYVSQAVAHLSTIDNALQALKDLSNLSVHGAIQALDSERALLVKECAAHAEADDLIRIYRSVAAGRGIPRNSPETGEGEGAGDSQEE